MNQKDINNLAEDMQSGAVARTETDFSTEHKEEVSISRRKMLQAIGIGSVMLAGSALFPKLAFADSEAQGKDDQKLDKGAPSSMLQVANIQALSSIPKGQLKEGTLVYVSGYYTAGDGGGQVVRWSQDSTAQANGGTVHQGSGIGAGRWLTIHNGAADFRWFGIFGPGQNADDALDAMVNDPSIHRIEAHTNLNFIRRHVFHRSHIELDFGGHTVTTDGIELNTRDNPFGAVLFFQGTQAGGSQTVTLSAAIPEGRDVLEVSNASAFQVDDWWIARISNNSGGSAQRELDYLVKVTEIVSSKSIRVNYKLGWPLAAGRTITYTKMNPVFHCHVRNMQFVGVPVPANPSPSVRPFETWDQIGSNPVAYEFAVECNVSGIRATKVFWPVIQRRYCSHYITEQCELINPEERDWGGTGYLTQQLNVLYGHVRDCNTSNARHLNDFTCAAYSMVENCHGDGDDYGPFVTHGQYEHDLVYIGNSGLLSFANSGTTWGDSAKRITVKKHIATRIVANKRLTDLTLEDCYAIVKEGLANSGSIWANVDGLQMRGCTAENMITLSKGSSLSKRKNIIDSSSFGMLNGYEIARPIRANTVGYTPINGDLHISNCEFFNVEDVNIGSLNKLTLINTWFKGASPTTGKVRVGTKEIVIQGGGFINCGFVLTGAWDKSTSGNAAQSVTLGGGAHFSGTNGEKAFFKSTEAGNAVTFNIGQIVSAASDADTAHFHIEGTANRLHSIGAHFKGGKYAADDGGFGADNFFCILSCVEEGVDRTSLPAEEGDTIKHGAAYNMIF